MDLLNRTVLMEYVEDKMSSFKCFEIVSKYTKNIQGTFMLKISTHRRVCFIFMETIKDALELN